MTQPEAEQFFRAYARAFDAFDAKAIASYCDLPCVITGPDRSGALVTAEQVVRNFEAVNDNHRALGYHRAVLTACAVIRTIGASFAEADVVWSFRRDDDSEIYAFPMTYLLRKPADQWKISCAISPDP